MSQNVPGDYQYRALTSGPSFQRFWHRHKLELFSRIVQVGETDVVLEVGCGSGNFTFHVCKNVSVAYGLDISGKAVQFCAQRVAREDLDNVRFFLASADAIPLADATIDCLVFAEVIEHLEEPLVHLRELYRLLRPGGRLFVTTPNYRSLWPVLEKAIDLLNLAPKMRNEQHIARFDKTKLESLLRTVGFIIQKIGSFYVLSPFCAMISERLATRLFSLEFETQALPGMLVYCLAYKPTN